MFLRMISGGGDVGRQGIRVIKKGQVVDLRSGGAPAPASQKMDRANTSRLSALALVALLLALLPLVAAIVIPLLAYLLMAG